MSIIWTHWAKLSAMTPCHTIEDTCFTKSRWEGLWVRIHSQEVWLPEGSPCPPVPPFPLENAPGMLGAWASSFHLPRLLLFYTQELVRHFSKEKYAIIFLQENWNCLPIAVLLCLWSRWMPNACSSSVKLVVNNINTTYYVWTLYNSF